MYGKSWSSLRQERTQVMNLLKPDKNAPIWENEGRYSLNIVSKPTIHLDIKELCWVQMHPQTANLDFQGVYNAIQNMLTSHISLST